MDSKYSTSRVQFHFSSSSLSLRDRKKLKSFLIRLFNMEKQELWSLTYVFCSDEYLLDINKEYLNHDYFTDIITFNLANADQPVEGEIYISLDRVKENAHKLGQSYKDELHRVIFHGALHLCGFKDKTLEEKTRMRKKEDKYLDLYFR